MRSGFKHLRTKLTVLYTTLFVATLAIVAFVAYASASRNVEHIGRDQLAASGVAFDNLLASRNASLEDKAEILSKDYGFRAALASRDQATVRSALDNLASRLGIDMAFVIDAQGAVTAKDVERDKVLPSDVLVSLKGDDPVSGLFQFRGRPYQAVSTPIMMPAPAGWVVFATPLDKAEMARLDRLSAIPLQASVVGRRPSEPWAGIGAAALAEPRLKAFAQKAETDQTIARLGLLDGDALALVKRLPTLGQGDQVLLLRYPMAEALKPFNALFETILAVGLGGVVLLIFGSWLIARTVTRPISQLEQAAHQLQRGETARVKSDGADEIARLGESFNAMADGIREREQSLEKARDAAREADRVKGEFLANMNHEFRTPLNGVLGSASVLTSTGLDASQRRMVNLIQSSGEGLLHILDGVLDMIELGAGEIRLLDEPFDLCALVQNASDAAASASAQKGLAFVYETSGPEQIWLSGDARRVKQIIDNLLDNAVKFTDHGTISVRLDHGGPSAWFVRVADTGIGFDPAEVETMFAPFRQADGSITRRFGGTGMGLSLARDLARAMDGDIVATGAQGRGACFALALNLPAAAAASLSVHATPPDLNEEEATPLRVLLAEDNPANRTVVELILSAVDANTTSTENGAEALDAFKTESFDVVLMDLQMPVMDGLTAITGIRRHESAQGLKRTPIIVLSANVQTEHLKASAAAGADLHLAKPIVASALIQALEKVLDLADEQAAA